MSFSKIKSISLPIFESSNLLPQHENLLKNIIWAIIIINLVIGPIRIYFLADPLPAIFISILYLSLQFSLLILINRGYLATAKVAFLLIIWVFITAVLYFLGGVRNPVINAFMILILMTGILIGRKGALLVSGLSVVSTVFIFYLEYFDQLPTSAIPINDVYLGSTVFLILIIMAVVLYFALRAIENVFMQTKENERHLKLIFESASVALIEQDFSMVIKEIEELRERGVTNFRTYFEQNEEHVQELASKVIIKDCNSATIAMYEATSKMDLLDSIDTLFANNTYDDFREELVAIGEKQSLFQTETKNISKKGREFPILLSLRLPQNKEDFSNLIVAVHDISTQRQVEQKLRESERQFEHFMEQLPGAVVIKDNNRQITFCNSKFAAINNKIPEELIGRKTEEYLSNTVAEKVEKENASVLASGMPREFVHRSEGEQGESFWLTRKFPIFREENPPLLGAISLDYTSRKKAEENLIKSEMLYRSLIDNTNMLLNRWLPDTTLTYANEEYLKIFGIPKEYYGISWASFYPEENYNHTINRYQELSENPDVEVSESKIMTPDNEEKVFRWIVTPLEKRNGKVIEFQGVGIDITELKKAENVLKAHQQELKKEVTAQTEKLQDMVDLMVGREVRMAELKKIINQLQTQLTESGIEPIAKDPLAIHESE